MDAISIEKLIELVKTYNEEEVTKVYAAYILAEQLHQGQKRNSGEDYIIHPLSVAYILGQLHADGDTLCAGLLHDTLEDTEITKEEIETKFGPIVANLVDGVTKMSKLDFSSSQEADLANTRKIIVGCLKDVRIIIIKLADRLHNMRTLNFKRKAKQQKKAQETIDIFVPLAYYIGAYYLKNELEDLSLMYLDNLSYEKIKLLREKEKQQSSQDLQEMVDKIKQELDTNHITSDIKIYTKNIYGIYKRLKQGHNIEDIHDLFSLKILVKEVQDCYIALGCIHKLYHPYDKYFKDYLFNPKENDYRSLHTTVFQEHRLVQLQIRTFEMEKTNTYGLIHNWDTSQAQAPTIMQQKMRNYLFRKAIAEMNQTADDNEFLQNVTTEVFGEKIFVYTQDGTGLSLPKSSTPIDFAYAISEKIGDYLTGALVNGKPVPLDYQLQNFDRVTIITDYYQTFSQKEELFKNAKTNHAKIRLLEKNNQPKNTKPILSPNT